MPEVVSPELVRAIQGLEFGALVMLVSGIVGALTLWTVRGSTRSQAEQARRDAANAAANIANQGKLIENVGQVVAVMADQAGEMRRMDRTNRDGFSELRQQVADNRELAEKGIADIGDQLKGLRSDMVDVKKSLTNHTSTYTNLAERVDAGIERLDAQIEQLEKLIAAPISPTLRAPDEPTPAP